MSGNVWICLEVAGNGWKLLEMVINNDGNNDNGNNGNGDNDNGDNDEKSNWMA